MLLFYVYAYLRKSDGTPFYIGKGKNRRAWDKDHNVKVPEDKSRIILIETNLSEVGALALERRMIRWYGRKDNGTGILRNMTDGGDMPPSTKGIPKTAEHNRKNSEAHKGVIFSEETRKKMSDAKKGKIPACTYTRKTRKGKDNPNYGKLISEEQKEKIKMNSKSSVKVSCDGVVYRSKIDAARSHGFACVSSVNIRCLSDKWPTWFFVTTRPQ